MDGIKYQLEEYDKQVQTQKEDDHRQLKEYNENQKKIREAMEKSRQNAVQRIWKDTNANNYRISKPIQYSLNHTRNNSVPFSGMPLQLNTDDTNFSLNNKNRNNIQNKKTKSNISKSAIINNPLDDSSSTYNITYNKPVDINKYTQNVFNKPIDNTKSDPVINTGPADNNLTPADNTQSDISMDVAHSVDVNGDVNNPILVDDTKSTADAILLNDNKNINDATQDDAAAAPVLANNAKQDVEAPKPVTLKKEIEQDKANKNKEEQNTNEFDIKFKYCNDEESLRKVRDQLKIENDRNKDQINNECYSKLEAISNYYSEKKSQCESGDKRLTLINEEIKYKNKARKDRETLCRKNEAKRKKIDQAYYTAFEYLFNKIYNNLLSKNLKDNSIIENLIKNNEIVFFYSLDPENVQNFINLQKAVSKLPEDPKNTEALNTEKNNKFLEYVKTCNKEQSNNISMLYYQIYLNLSGKINSEKKIDQTLDLFGLKDLLLDFNDKTLADEDSYYNNLNNELIYAVINDYRDSNTSIDLYIKQLSNNQDNTLKKYSQQYKKRISTIFDKRIDKQTDDVLKNYEIEEKNKSLQMLNNIKSEQWNKSTEAADKYLTAFDILVNVVNQYK